MLRFAPRLTAILLGASLLSGCASAMSDFGKLTGSSSKDADDTQTKTAKIDKALPTDLEGGIRQAQLMRNAGQYDDAIHVLSQLMLVASDDPRVVSEYGKSLAQKGRAKDAVDFLSRAVELSGNDWTLYSALGVSYDQLGNQAAARASYEHALALKPNEPSVLNNYALSRMLANDPDGARQLIAQAKNAGGDKDAKIAANIAMLSKLAPDAPKVAEIAKPVAADKSAAFAKPVPLATNNVAVNAAPAKPMPQPAQAAPRPIAPPPMAQQRPQTSPPQQMAAAPSPQQTSMRPSGVVMQAVPFDPYAGPVKGPATPAKAQVKPAKPAPAKTATAPAQPNDLEAPKALVKAAMLEPPKIVIAEPAKQPDAAAKVAKKDVALMPPKIVIAESETKPDAKPSAKNDKQLAKAGSNAAVPALRLTADARSP